MSLIGSFRSDRLKAKAKQEMDLDTNLTPHERMHEFVISHGSTYILPYLDLSDLDRFKLSKTY